MVPDLFVGRDTFVFCIPVKTDPAHQIGIDFPREGGQTLYLQNPSMPALCKHPQVRVVAREEDTEFVECQSCGEVFDSIEFEDILREGEPLPEELPAEDEA